MADPNTIPFREADTNGHYKSKQLPQDKDEFLVALGLPTFAGDVTTGSSGGTAGGEVATFFSTSGHVIKAANQTGLAKLTTGVLSSVPAPTGAVVGDSDVQTLTNKTLNSPQINTPTGLTKYDVGLGNVDNTSDTNKPPPASVTSALATKEDKTNKGISSGYASLDSAGKLPMSQVPDAIIGASRYQGTWNAATNSPAIPAAAPGNNGYYYSVAVAGTTNINGIATWAVGDTIISNGSVWQKIPVSNAVQSVNAKTGIVVIDKNDVGLGNVDNTSDSTKWSAVATLTNKTIDGSANTLNVRLNTGDVSGSLPVNKLNGGVNASGATFWRGDGQWVSPTGAGDVLGPGSSSDGAVALFNGVTGKSLKTFAGAAGFAKLDTVGVVATQAQMQAGDISAAMITGQTEKTVLVDPDDKFLEVDNTTGLLRYIRAKWFSKLPRNWLSGLLTATNLTNLSNGIDVAAGECRDDSNSADMVLGTAITNKKVDVAWVAGSGQGGRDSTVALGDGNWQIWLIKNSSTGVVDVLLSNLTPTLPSGYTLKRRIGAFYRATGANRRFEQMGDYFMYLPYQMIVNSTFGTNQVVTTTSGAPVIGKRMKVVLQVQGSCTAGWFNGMIYSDASFVQNASFYCPTANFAGGAKVEQWTASDGSVQFGTGGAANNVAMLMWCLGWYDTRDKDS